MVNIISDIIYDIKCNKKTVISDNVFLNFFLKNIICNIIDIKIDTCINEVPKIRIKILFVFNPIMYCPSNMIRVITNPM